MRLRPCILWLLFLLAATPAVALTNGVSKPYLGWNSFYTFGSSISGAMITNQANAMVATGMRDAGWRFIALDAYWDSGVDGNNVPKPDTAKFPENLQKPFTWVHSLGLSNGLYCAGDLIGSGYSAPVGDNWTNAFSTWSGWGVDLIKLDFLNRYNSTWAGGTIQPIDQAERAKYAILGCNHPIVFNLATSMWPVDGTLPPVCNSSRTSSDYPSPSAFSDTLTRIDDFNTAAAAGYYTNGFQPDPDYLQIDVPGNTMTTTEKRTAFFLPAVQGAPLMVAMDMTALSETTIALLTNTEIIAINQDDAIQPGLRVSRSAVTGGNKDIYSKGLANGRAVACFNGGSGANTFTVDFTTVELGTNVALVRDAVNHTIVGIVTNSFTTPSVTSHDTVVYTLTPPPFTYYIDVAATGANTGLSWADACTSLYFAHSDSNYVRAGDTVYVKGGDYTTDRNSDHSGEPLRLTAGTSDNWTRYIFTNGVSQFYCLFLVNGFTELNGGVDRPSYETNFGKNTYLTPMITNNCNLWIRRETNWFDVGSSARSILVKSEPVSLKWIHISGATNVFADTPPYFTGGDSASEILYDLTGTVANYNELAYIWVHGWGGYGSGAAIKVAPATTPQFKLMEIHHCLLEMGTSDNFGIDDSTDIHHCVIRDRWGTYGGSTDNIEIPHGGWYCRIHHNLWEPTDNVYLYWGGDATTTDLYNLFFYDNIFTPQHPASLNGVTDYGGPANINFGGPAENVTTVVRSNVYWLNNTVPMTTNGGMINLMTFIIRGTGPNDPINCKMYFDTGAFVIKNNLFVRIDGNPGSGLNLYGGTSAAGTYWTYPPEALVLDYNMWWSTNRTKATLASWSVGTNPPVNTALTNATSMNDVAGYSHNVTETPVTFADAANWDFHPSASARVAEDLTSLTNLMEDLDLDIYGNRRPVGAAWSAGAIEDNSLVLHLTFNSADWATNGNFLTVTDHSGWTNNATGFDATGWPTNIWPHRVAGPGNLSAAEFDVNYVDGGGFTYGDYLGVTNFGGGLESFTNGTWALWARDDVNVGSGYHSFLNCGYGSETWRFFGQYYDKAYPAFAKTLGAGEGDPLQLVRWPAITDTGWHHYAATWDGTYAIGYLDGTPFQTNNIGGTNGWSGLLNSTNDAGTYNWIAIGVATHNGTPSRIDGDNLPNHGQMNGALADIRIYKRALSDAEIGAIYSATNGSNPAPPANNQSSIHADRLTVGTVHFGP